MKNFDKLVKKIEDEYCDKEHDAHGEVGLTDVLLYQILQELKKIKTIIRRDSE